MDYLLQQGQSVAIHVGGIAEMFESHPDRETIFLRKRRGFIKAAVSNGVSVLPMFHFGNSQILKFVPRCVSCFCHRVLCGYIEDPCEPARTPVARLQTQDGPCRFMQPVSRKLRMSLGVFVGQFGLPIPRWAPVWTVAGAPIHMGSGMSPDEEGFTELVEAKHAEFTAALVTLYEEHRGAFFDGAQFWTDRPLELL